VLRDGGVEVATDRNEVRERLRRMSDEQLRDFGRACVYMCSPKANLGKAPLEPFVIQLEEARDEWKRRGF
jgi:hypothetical protein